MSRIITHLAGDIAPAENDVEALHLGETIAADRIPGECQEVRLLRGGKRLSGQESRYEN